MGVFDVRLGGTWVNVSTCTFLYVCQFVKTYLVLVVCTWLHVHDLCMFRMFLVLWVQVCFYKWCGVLTCNLSSRDPSPGGRWPQEG